MSLIEANIQERIMTIILFLNKKLLFCILLLFSATHPHDHINYYHINTALEKLTPINEYAYNTQETKTMIISEKELISVKTHEFSIPCSKEQNVEDFEASFREYIAAIKNITFIEITFFYKSDYISPEQEIIIEKVITWCQKQNITAENILKNRYYSDNGAENEEYIVVTFFNLL